MRRARFEFPSLAFRVSLFRSMVNAQSLLVLASLQHSALSIGSDSIVHRQVDIRGAYNDP